MFCVAGSLAESTSFSATQFSTPAGNITSDRLKQILPGLIGNLYPDHSKRVVQSDTRKPSTN
jgi:hypothetical protein